MRRLLGALRQGDDLLELAPHPGLDDLEALAGDVRAAGLDVRLHVHGEPVALPRSLDLSAYRIVQEGLTNALKHSGATPGRRDRRLRARRAAARGARRRSGRRRPERRVSATG